jgi:uncharacterized protein
MNDMNLSPSSTRQEANRPAGGVLTHPVALPRMTKLKIPLLVDESLPVERVRGNISANLLACARYVSQRGALFAAGKTWQAMRLLFSLREHVLLMKLLSHPQSALLIQDHPRLPFKYLGNYIALRLPLRVRRSILAAHYRFLQQKFSVKFLDFVLRSPPVLWQSVIDERAFKITVDYPDSDYEGDLRFVFSMDDSEVYKLIFVFASGREFDLPGEVIVVTNIQGAPDFDRVKVATKTCYDIQPAHILMAAASGLAEATRVSCLLGFHETRQISNGHGLIFSYHKFFATYGDEIGRQKMYRVPLPYSEKPVADIRSNHRNRNLRKRRFKAGIRSQVIGAVRGYLKNATC